jgi:hypothetical protein
MYSETSEAISAADPRRRRRSDEERLAGVVKAIDVLLFSLEELNLQGVDRVPTGLRKRAAELIEQGRPSPPPEDRTEDPYRVRYRVVPLMDMLFELQDVIQQRRHPARPLEPDELQGD